MVADAQRKLRGQHGARQWVLEPNFVDSLRPVTQAKGGEQPPLYRLFHGEGFVFNGGPHEVVIIEVAPDAPAAEEQQCLEVRQGDNEVTVAGDNVTSVDIVAANGATVASATGNTVAINGLSAGIYVVKAVVDGKTVAHKIQIVK